MYDNKHYPMFPISQKKNIVLTSKHEGKKFGLDAHFIDNGEPKPVIVFVHGFNGFKDWGAFNGVADFFAAHEFTFVKFNLSHNGTTVERPTEIVDLHAYGHDYFSTDLDDLGLVINYLHDKNCAFARELDLNNLFLIGHSRGGAVVILKAGEDPRVKGISTWASIKSTMHFWLPERIAEVEAKGVIYVQNGRTQQKLPLYRGYYEDALFNPLRLDVEAKIKGLEIPILIAHGSSDPSVPVEAAQQLKEWQPNAELMLIEGAAHTFGAKHPFTEENLPDPLQHLCNHTLAFFQRNLNKDQA